MIREAIAKRMRALPAAVDRFERVKDDRDFRLLFLLRYAAAMGASLRLTDATAGAPDDGGNATNGDGIVETAWSHGPRRDEHFRERSLPWRKGIGRFRELVFRCSPSVAGCSFVPANAG